MASVFGPPSQDRLRQASDVRSQIKSPPAQSAQVDTPGASIYLAACATCHESERPLPYGGVNLGLSTALSAPDPRNAVNIVLSGIRPVAGQRSPIMPGFAASMTNAQISALLTYLRGRFSNQPAWTDVEKTVEDARPLQTVYLQTPPGPHNAPGDPTQRDKP
jgi:mono/diheme cytochrome c family protein